MSKTKSKISQYPKKQENIINTKKKGQQKNNSENQMLKFVYKGIKRAIITMFKDIKENIVIINKRQ